MEAGLATVIDRWPALPEAVRLAIVAAVKAAASDEKGEGAQNSTVL